MAKQITKPPVAIVGVSALFPGSSDLEGYWQDIVGAKDLIKEVPPNYWLVEDYYDPDPTAADKTYCKRGGFLDKLDFDPVAFGIPPSLLPSTDTAQLLALLMAKRVLEDACQGDFEDMNRDKVSVFLGVAAGLELLGQMASRLQRPIWVKAMREAGLPEAEVQDCCDRITSHFAEWKESTFPGLLGNVVAGRVANRFDFGGTNCTTDAACASSLSALSVGINELYLGDSDLVIAGGVDATNDPFLFMCFSKTPALSASGDCRPFSSDADGTMLGEGVGLIAMKRLEDAERDGDRIYAVIKGVGTSSDGRAKSVYAPRPSGQAVALNRAYERAGYGPETVELIEAHGTGTAAGDLAEFGGLRQVFEGSGREDTGWCALGSVKSQIGHTKSAAGAAGIIKAAMALNHGVLPPTIKVDKPREALEVAASPFYLNTEARPWIRGDEHPRRASVSSFGFGGTNYHVALEAYDGEGHRAWRRRAWSSQLLLLSAADAKALASRCTELAETCKDNAALTWLARSSQQSFEATAAHRLAIVASTPAEAKSGLEMAASRVTANPAEAFSLPNGVTYAAGTADPGEVAFLFPGQGSQRLGMGGELGMHFEVARAAWDRHATFPAAGGLRLHEVVYPVPKFTDEDRAADQARLRATDWAQPALGQTSMSMLRLLESLGLKPAMVGGHSFGEITALHAAGVLDEDTMLDVARKRGELMAAEAAKAEGGDPADAGAMTAVSHPQAEIERILSESKTGVVIANANSPEQVVLSGTAGDLDTVEVTLKAAGARVKRLPVATAFHSTIVAAATEPFEAWLKEVTFADATCPVYSNTEAAPYPAAAAAQRALLAGQIAKPVRFGDEIEAMYAAGARTFVEVGSGSVLTGLVTACLGDREHAAISLDRKGAPAVTQLWRALGSLAVAGVSVDLEPLWADTTPVVDPATIKPPTLAIPIDGTNYQKPYPPEGGAQALPAPNPPRPEPEPVVVHVPAPAAASPASGSVASAAAPVAMPAPVAAPVQAAGPTPAWLEVYERMQMQTADIHAQHMRQMADVHQAYLQAAETTTQQLVSTLQGGVVPTLTAAPVVVAPTPALAAPAPTPVVAPVVAPAPVPVAVAPKPAPVAAPTPAPAPVAAAPSVDMSALLLEVVADKTGYPAEILRPEMSLEADLGIDSIKRVEILGAVRDAAPGLPDVDASEMAALQTIGEVLSHLEAAMPAGASAPATAPVAAAPATPGVDMKALLLEVVADKTGYPAEILRPEMSLEADLGIDSIKRVEILGAVRDAAPGLPDVDASEMAALQTIGEVLAHLESAMPSTAPAAAATPSVDMKALLLSVVADKTGYPADILRPEMSLEADLGIDSIKRVEILGAVRDAAPGLPDVDASEMAALQTIGEVLAHLESAMPSTATSAPAAAATPSVDMKALLLSVVADKTGYPADILRPEMSLEADLGIDSIKRVEILGAVRDAVPGLPDVDASEMAALQTIGEVLAHLEAALPGGEPAAAPAKAAEVTTGAAVTPAARTPRYVVGCTPAPAAGFTLPGLSRGPVGVLDAGSGVGEALATALTDAGVQAELVDAWRDELAGVIFLGGLAPLAAAEDASALAQQAFLLAQQVVKAQPQAVFVTVQQTGGGFGTTGPVEGHGAWTAGLTGLVRTLAIEQPTMSAKAIDLERGGRSEADLAAALTGELLYGGPELAVGLTADGARLVPTQREVEVSPAESAVLGSDDVLVASGGARGVTAACLIAVAKRSQPKMVLLGRTPLADEPDWAAGVADEPALMKAAVGAGVGDPATIRGQVKRILAGREVRGTLDALSAAGSEARYVAADVTDADAVSTALAGVREDWGPVTGILHGAGVLADKRIEDKTLEQFDRVYRTKVAGLQALLAATADDALKAICLFSSVAARYGNAGQSDYAMANEVLNKVARDQAARRDGCAVVSIGWGPWDGGMVTPALAKHFAAMGVPLVPLQGGAEALADELGGGDVEIVIGGPSPLVGLSSGSADGACETEVRVSATTHPFLDSHRVKNVPVVPVVLVLEWFTRTAKALYPGVSIKQCKDLKVLKGIQLDGFENGGTAFTVRWRSTGTPEAPKLAMELVSSGDTRHYSAELEMAFQGAETPAPVDASTLDLQPWKWSPEEVYGEHLFHGGDFAVIRALEGVSDTAGTAELAGTREMGWQGGTWQTDAAALDGGLQLAILWGEHVLGQSSLPTKVGSYQAYADDLSGGPIKAVLKGRTEGSHRTVSDIAFVDDDGQVLAELRDVEMHMLPKA